VPTLAIIGPRNNISTRIVHNDGGMPLRLLSLEKPKRNRAASSGHLQLFDDFDNLAIAASPRYRHIAERRVRAD